MLSIKPLMYARAIPAKFGSLPSRRIWMTASRSALRSAVQPAGMIDGHRRPAVIERLRDGCGIGEVGGDPEIGRGAQTADEVAAQVRLLVVHDDRFDVFHIEAEGIAEQEDEEQRDGKGEVEAPEVPDQMIDLLAVMALTFRRVMPPPLRSSPTSG